MSKIIPSFSRGEFSKHTEYLNYIDGFLEAENKYKELVEALLDALERRNADDFVDAFRGEYEL